MQVQRDPLESFRTSDLSIGLAANALPWDDVTTVGYGFSVAHCLALVHEPIAAPHLGPVAG